MATVLELAQAVCREISIYPPTLLVNATEEIGKQMKEIVLETGDDVRSASQWPELRREHTLTLVTGTASYALPADFDRFAFETIWNRTQHWQISGPVSPQEWQNIKSGTITTSPFQRFTVKGVSSTEIFLDPTPVAGDNGAIVAFEYFSTNVFRPRTWAASTSYLAGSYSFYNGNNYYSSAGGVSGATPPTHVVGSASDGGVSWAYNTAQYSTILADTDVVVLDERLFKLALRWRFMLVKGLNYGPFKELYELHLKKREPAKKSASTLSLSSRGRYFRGPRIPETIS